MNFFLILKTILKRYLKIGFGITLIAVFFLAKNSFAQVSLIRDAETEKFLRQMSEPIFRAAGLNPDNIAIYIVNDNSINAFVSGGQNVFINTGLIRKYQTPDTLIGVIAHEAGHISAGHLARSAEAIEQAQGAMLLSYLLGAGAIVAGAPDAGIALIAGGSDSANRLFMKFTRTQEEAADQHALEYLQTISYPADGLVKLLEFFDSEMIGYRDQIDEYLLSHPVSRKRINLIKNRTAHWTVSDKKINNKLQGQMNIVLAKLEGFTDNPDYIIDKYKNHHDDKSNYIKAIAFFRKGKIKESLTLLDPIIDKNVVGKKVPRPLFTNHIFTSQLGFLWELKGQILYESGDIQNSIIAYNNSLKLLSNRESAQVKIAFASAVLALKTSDQDLAKLAIKKLEEAQLFENLNPFLFKQLATAYSKTNDEGRSFLALAEYNLLINKKKKCRKYAKKAKKKLAKSAKKELLRADDLIELVKEKDEDE